MFESRISATATEKLPGWEKLHGKTVAWSHDMEGHAQKCVERYCELANKEDSNCTESQFLSWTTISSKKEELETVGELSKVCAQIVKMLEFARIGRFDILSPYTSLLEQSQNRQELVIDAQLVWLPTFITRMITNNIVMWETRLSIVDWVYSWTQTVFATLKTQNQPRSNICPHKLDVPSRMDGIPCSRSMGCGDQKYCILRRTPIKQWEITVEKKRSMIKCREVEHAKHQPQHQINKRQ